MEEHTPTGLLRHHVEVLGALHVSMVLLLTRPMWFGPRRSGGWGWSPVAWQGHAVIAAFLVAVIWAGTRPDPQRLRLIGAAILGLVAVTFATGTAPGME